MLNRRRLGFEPLEDRRVLSVDLQLVKDINTSPGIAGSNPIDLVEVNGIVFFSAETATTGRELWKSDGTEAGTVRVKDILAGNNSSLDAYVPSLTNVGGTLYFSANDGSSGKELWKSDGTEAGTVRVKDILPGSGWSYPVSLTNVGGTLYFSASDGSSGKELWKSDGTEAGTIQVKDILPGGYGSDPRSLTNVGGTLYFSANDGNSNSGNELWKSDGTEAGTVQVKDIGSGSFNSSYPGSLTNVGGTLYFIADDGIFGKELWKSDGTETGTVQVKDIQEEGGGIISCDINGRCSSPNLTNVGGTLYFSPHDEKGFNLWKSDGTEAGTVRVTGNLRIISCAYGHCRNPSLTNVAGMLYFSADDGSSGYELWKSDGTEGGTIQVKDIRPGFGESFLESLTNVGGTLYFGANDGNNGFELWKSDGTETGTMLVEDLTGDSGSAFPAAITLVGNRLFVVATNNVYGREPWSGSLGSLQGDFDRNGLLDLVDIDALVSAIAGGADPIHFDLTNDGQVSGRDLDLWLQLAGTENLGPGRSYLKGDANLDGVVDGSDFGTWNANKFTSVAAWSRGDFNADGVVDGTDFGIWNSHKFTSADATNQTATITPLVALAIPTRPTAELTPACRWLNRVPAPESRLIDQRSQTRHAPLPVRHDSTSIEHVSSEYLRRTSSRRGLTAWNGKDDSTVEDGGTAALDTVMARWRN